MKQISNIKLLDIDISAISDKDLIEACININVYFYDYRELITVNRSQSIVLIDDENDPYSTSVKLIVKDGMLSDAFFAGLTTCGFERISDETGKAFLNHLLKSQNNEK